MIGWFSLVSAVVAMSLLAAQAERFPGDLVLTDWIQAVDFQGLDSVSTAIYALGLWPTYIVVGAVVGAICWRAHQRLAAGFVGLALLAHGTTVLLKELIERPRPAEDLVRVVGDPSGFSFPSGHVLGAVLLWGFVVYVAPMAISSRRACRAVRGAALIIIVMMGIQRVYAGAHWPSDVVGGYLWGGLVLTLIIGAFEITRRRATRPEPWAPEEQSVH
jgi:undecaprenyl-diphosphatase